MNKVYLILLEIIWVVTRTAWILEEHNVAPTTLWNKDRLVDLNLPAVGHIIELDVHYSWDNTYIVWLELQNNTYLLNTEYWQNKKQLLQQRHRFSCSYYTSK